jgi:hypothetical protein
MRKTALMVAVVAWAAGCGGGGTSSSVPVGPSSVGGDDGGMPGGGGGGTGGAGGGGAGGGGSGGSGGGGAGGGGSGGSGGSGGGGAGGGGSGGGGSGGSGGGMACDAPTPVTVVANLPGTPDHLAVDDRWVYYIDLGSASLWRILKDGSGAPERIAFLGATNEVAAWDYAVDATTIYVMQFGRAGATLEPGSVSYLDKSLHTVRTVYASSAPGDCHTPTLLNIAVANGDVYWLQSNGSRASDCAPVPDDIMRVPAGSSTPQRLTSGSTNGGITGIFADAYHLFWSDSDGILRIGRTGGAREILAPGYGARMTSDGNNLFAEATSGAVERISAPGAYATIYNGPLADMESDGTHLYVSAGTVKGGGSVLRMNGDGSSQTVLAPVNSFTVTVDDRYVYFDDGPTIKKLCK